MKGIKDIEFFEKILDSLKKDRERKALKDMQSLRGREFEILFSKFALDPKFQIALI